MALIKNGAEAGTNGVTATTANTGGGADVALSTVSLAGTADIKFSTEQVAKGSLAYKFITNASDVHYLEWIVAANASVAARCYIYVPALGPSANGILQLRTNGGGTPLLAVLFNNALVQIQDTTSTVIWDSGAVSLPTGQWLRVEIGATNGNTATGTCNLDIYAGDSLTPIAGLSAALTGRNFGSAGFGRVRWGRFAAFSTLASFYMDLLAYQDGSSTYIGPAVNNPPTVNAGADQTVGAASLVSLASSASDTDGTIASTLWTFDYPTSGAPALTGATALNASFTSGAAGSFYILRQTATDNDGVTGFDTLEVRVPLSGATAGRPIVGNGTGSGSWSTVGGSATEGEALADESDTTYVQSAAVSGVEQTRRYRIQPSGARATADIKIKLATDTGTANATVRLYEGATLRQSWSQALTTTNTEYTFAFSGGTLAAITDWGNLYVEVGVTS